MIDFTKLYASCRNSKFVCGDVTTYDWSTISSTMNGVVDYISFDVDDATRAAFDNFPFNTFRCKTLTIEHDAYRVGNNLRDYIRSKLISYGYILVFGNVVCKDYGAFEDWFVDPKYIDKDMLVNLMEIRCDNTDSTLIEDKLLKLNAA